MGGGGGDLEEKGGGSTSFEPSPTGRVIRLFFEPLEGVGHDCFRLGVI